MTKNVPVFLILAVVTLATPLPLLAQQPPRPQEQQPRPIEEAEDRPEGRATLRVEIEQIRVDVTVQDKKGNLIQGLNKGHFKVYENKVEQEITNFSPIEAPMTAVLVAEYSRLLPWTGFLEEVYYASHYFVRGMREGDFIAIIAYDIRPEILTDFTSNPAEALDALRRLNFPAFSESNMYDAVIDTLDRLEEVEGKTAVVLVSSGLDTFSKHNLDDLLRTAKKTNVVIYPVAVGGNVLARYEHRLPASTRMDFYQAEATLKALARFTGGEAFFPRFLGAFPGIFETISALLRNQYSLSYVSSNPSKDGKFRKIKVEVNADVNGDGKPDKLKVNHKEGYLADDK